MFTMTQKTKEKVSILQLQGRFDYTKRQEFFSAIKNAEETQPKHIILDLSQLNSIDSAPIGWMVTIFHQLRRQSQHVQFTLAGQRGGVDASLKCINLERLIPTVGSVDEALVLPPSYSSSEQPSLS